MKEGRGIFARIFMEDHPLIPVEEEGRLQDPRLRENFFARVFAFRRWKGVFSRRWTAGDAVRFHTSEKFLLRAHDEKGYGELGRLTAHVKSGNAREWSAAYGKKFMETLAVLPTVRKHANVLQHMSGYVKEFLSSDEKKELGEAIDDFRRGLTPLLVPVTLLRHHVRRHKVAYLEGQTYIEPHPKELTRNFQLDHGIRRKTRAFFLHKKVRS